MHVLAAPLHAMAHLRHASVGLMGQCLSDDSYAFWQPEVWRSGHIDLRIVDDEAKQVSHVKEAMS